MSRFREGSVAIRAGIADSWSSMPASVLQRVRDAGCRVYWPAAELYRVLGVKAFKGMPSRWFQACRKSWQEHIEGHFPGQHIVQSTNSGDKSNTDIPESGDASRRRASTPSCSWSSWFGGHSPRQPAGG
eukprot:3930633-Pyramimonas_sp.AAC.1